MVERRPTLMRAWLSQLLAQKDYPSAHIDESQKKQFLTKLLRYPIFLQSEDLIPFYA